MRPAATAAGAVAIAVLVLGSGVAAGQVVRHPRRQPPSPVVPVPAAPAVPAPAAATQAPAPKPVVVRARPRPKETAPVGPVPDIKLTIDTPTRLGPWTMRVTNAGDMPVRLVADARLLVLEVTPRSAAKPVRCELPADMRPADDMDSPLVLPPGRTYAERFEPRLYCFGGRLLDALAPGATVVARLGWTGGSKARPPFAVQSIEGVEPELAPLKTIDSLPVALPDDPAVTLSVPTPPRPDDPDPARLTVRGPATIDAPSPSNISVDVALHNEGKRPVTVRFRPETLRFDVSGPTGVEECRWPALPVAAMRELFTTLRPGTTADLPVLLAAYCSGRPFDGPGLLVVRPEMDTRKASGADIALRTFDGQVIATTPTLIRLHRGLKPQHLARPQLEPLPQPSPPQP